MDQVKQILAVLKKYHFWVLCGLLLLIGLGVWQMSVAALAGRYKERENKLTSQRKEVADIAKEPSPPNQVLIDAIKQAHEGLKDEVANASAFLYQMQKAKNPWPVQVLGEAFVEAAEALKPGDNYMKPGEEFKDEKYLEWYQNFINMYLPQLGLIADVRERKSERQIRVAPPQEKRILARRRAEKKKAEEEAEKKDSKAKTPSPDEGEDEVVGKVYWDNEFAITQRYDKWEVQPTTTQVLIAQEDLWVYEALLRIIRDTNEEASTYFKAPVKRIISLDIGQDAAKSLGGASRSSSGGGSITPLGGGMPGMAGGMPGMTGGMPGMTGGMPGMLGGSKSATLMGPSGGGAGSGMPSAGPGGGGGGDAGASPREAIARSLLDSRYVDAKGQPLAYGTDPPYPQFKMMPVRMVLVVDQRKIPRLLAQCANSSMPVEVKRVNLHFGSGQSSTFAGAKSGGGSGGMQGTTGGMPGMMGTAAGRPGAAAPGMAGTMGAMPGAMSGMGKSGSGGSGRSGATPGAMGAASGMSGPGMGRSSGSSRDEQTPWEATVELEGIIYIFNPPDTSKLGPRGAAPAGTPTPAAPAPDAAPGAAKAAPAATPPAAAPAAAPPAATPTPTPKK